MSEKNIEHQTIEFGDQQWIQVIRPDRTAGLGPMLQGFSCKKTLIN